MVDVEELSRRRVSTRRVPPPATGPELVVAVVSPVGTPDAEFHDALSSHLHGYGYETKRIKLSGILADIAEDRGEAAPAEPEDERIGALMTIGDTVCRDSAEAAAIALLGVNDVRAMREAATSNGSGAVRTAYVLDSVKRPSEVTQLRRIYGDHLLVIGLQASMESRKHALLDRLRPQRASASVEELNDVVDGLVGRDLRESNDEFDQNTLQTFPMADVFIDVNDHPAEQVSRVVDLLFGCPDYQLPTETEFGMHLANAATTRTAELGLKVGAVIMRGGQVLGIGVNEHPLPEGTPSFDASSVDIRGLVAETVESLIDLLDEGEKQKFRDNPDSYTRSLLEGPLRHSSVRQLTEFQPTVHAEMSALLDALEGGRPVAGGTVFVTAYPCHNCAKHLLALELDVTYLEPYPKSRAAAMYGPKIGSSFVPFKGVAPRRYLQLFEAGPDRKAADGTRLPWGPGEKRLAQPRVDQLIDQRGIEDREDAAISTLSLEEVTDDQVLVVPAIEDESN